MTDLRLQHPFDIALPVPELEERECPALQSDLLEAAIITSNQYRLGNDDFRSQPCISRPLDYYRDLYERRDRQTAINHLNKRQNIDWRTSSFHVSNTDPRLTWSIDEHYLDMLVCVSEDIGLAILLPNDRDHTFTFSFDFKQRHRQFSAKFAKLGFDAKSSFLYIGKSTSHDDVFIAWATVESLLEEGERVEVGLCTGKTTLSQDHYRITVMFFAYALTKLGQRGVWVHNRYPDLEDEKEFSDASNILEQSPQLTQTTMHELHYIIHDEFEVWIQNAPASYKKDSFIIDRKPIIVTSQYGQNQEMLDQDSTSWLGQRDFKHVHYMSFAIASHLRARIAEEWVPIEVQTIWREHKPLYRYPNTTEALTRRDLSNLELVDENQNEVPIYNKDGFRVKRRLAAYDSELSPLGVLVNLGSIHELFKTNHSDDTFYLHGRPGPTKPKVHVYPQAGLRSAGHFQASGLMTSFYPLIERTNEMLREFPEDLFPIEGVACQGYNTIMHSTRGYGVQHHEAQQGRVTAGIGGKFACDPSGKEKAKRVRNSLERCLPHTLFERKIHNASIKRDLRLENVYAVNVSALREDDQRGDIIFEEILWPLANFWHHSSIMDQILDQTVLFLPEAYPAIYSWTTFPLTALIQANWEEVKILEEKEKDETTLLESLVELTEVTACAERALNFMHTGNPAVIKTSVMNPLWIGRAIVHDGAPSFNPNLVKFFIHPFSHSRLRVQFANWPFDISQNIPQSTAESTLKYKYNDLAARNFLAIFSLKVLMEKPQPIAFLSQFKMGNADNRPSLLIYTTLKALTVDSKRLVSKAVTSACNVDLQSKDERVSSAATKRLESLAKWQKCKHPFAWDEPGVPAGQQTYQMLSKLFPQDDNPVQKSKNTHVSYSKVSQILVNFGVDDGAKTVPAPLVKDGTCPMLLRMAVPVTLKAFNQNQMEATISLWEQGLKAMHIDYLPWHGQHRNATSTTHKSWAYLQKPFSPIALELLDEDDDLHENATMAANEDPSASWTVPTRISEMGPLWDKIVLPLEWKLENATLDRSEGHKYVKDTYVWVSTNFDRSKPEHDLALILAIMFSKVLPNISLEKTDISSELTGNELTRQIRGLPWLPPTRKGTSSPPPYITMMSTYIIALLDSRSPLRIHLQNHNNTFGNPWTDKHTTKYITPLNLVRMGIAKAINPSIALRPMLGKNWDIEDPVMVEGLLIKIRGYLKTPGFGLFYAFRCVFGQAIAEKLAGQGQFPAAP